MAGQVGSAPSGQADEARAARRGCSIEYWFRCMDLDGDGVLSMFELEHFYEEQCRRLDSMAIEALPFEDCLCQMLDLVKPQNEGNGGRGRPGRCDTPPGRASLLRVGEGWAGPQARTNFLSLDTAPGQHLGPQPSRQVGSHYVLTQFRLCPISSCPLCPPVTGSCPVG